MLESIAIVGTQNLPCSHALPPIKSSFKFNWLKTDDACQKLNCQFAQTLSILPWKTRDSFGRLTQIVFFTIFFLKNLRLSIEQCDLARAPSESLLHLLQSSCSNFGYKDTAALYPQIKGEAFQKETEFFGWEFARFCRNVWRSKQVFTDSITETENWSWIYKVKRQPLCSLLYRYWTSKCRNWFIVPMWKLQILRFFNQKVWNTR